MLENTRIKNYFSNSNALSLGNIIRCDISCQVQLSFCTGRQIPCNFSNQAFTSYIQAVKLKSEISKVGYAETNT